MIQQTSHEPSPVDSAANAQRIRERAERVLNKVWEAYPDGTIIYGHSCLKFLAGRIDESEFFERRGQLAIGTAHYTVAMLRIAEGRHEEACEHLKVCCDTLAGGSFDYEFASACMTGMEESPK